MTAYIIRRVLWGILLLFLVSLLTFILFNVLPAADPAQLRAGRNASPRIIHYIRHELGLDKPIYVQFYDYMKNIILHGNFGYSYYSGQSVISLMKDRLPATLSLTVGAVILWLLMGIPIGIISAIKRGTFVDRASMGTALFFVSMPIYWLGLIVLFLFASDIGKFPILPGANSLRRDHHGPGQVVHLAAPSVVRAGGDPGRDLLAPATRQPDRDDGRGLHPHRPRQGTARAARVWRHGVRSAITPVVTVLALDIGALLGGAVLTETVFDIPGIGRLNYDAIVHSDFPIVQGTVLLAAMFIIVANIVVDIAYAYLDPRVRYS